MGKVCKPYETTRTCRPMTESHVTNMRVHSSSHTYLTSNQSYSKIDSNAFKWITKTNKVMCIHLTHLPLTQFDPIVSSTTFITCLRQMFISHENSPSTAKLDMNLLYHTNKNKEEKKQNWVGIIVCTSSGYDILIKKAKRKPLHQFTQNKEDYRLME